MNSRSVPEAFPPSVYDFLILNSYPHRDNNFGLWGIHINYAYYNSSVQGSCNLSYIVYLITIDSVIAVFIAAFFCVLISYAIVSTRMNKLDFIMTILINILRPGYSLLLSAGLVIAAAVYYYKGQCGTLCPEIGQYLIAYWVCLGIGVIHSLISFVMLIYVRLY